MPDKQYYFVDQTFKDSNYPEKKLNKGEYEYCTFNNCDFSNAKIFESRFLETKFVDCNFSNANLSQSSFQEVVFKNCKMLGLKFDECNQFNFAAAFEHCKLNYSSFYQMNLTRTRFNKSQLRGVDFIEANLKTTEINQCDLLDARFENTNLEKADLRNSFNYSIDPELNRVRGARFSFPEVIGLLDKFDIKINSKEENGTSN